MNQYHLHLRGYVGGSDFNATDVTATLRSNPDKEVTVLIDSTGGLLSTALSISSAFRSHGNVHAHFVGMNASAATIASLGAKRITMDASALYLVHKCSMSVFEWASMNSDQLQEYISALTKKKTDLDKFDDNVSAMYAARCRKPQEDLLALMKTGGWLTAKEALEWGFVDELTDFAEDGKPELTEDLAHAMVEAHMPLPTIPYAKTEGRAQAEPMFSRFMAALGSLFKTPHSEVQAQGGDGEGNHKQTVYSTTQKEMKHYELIEAALEVKDGFTPDAEGNITLTQEQMQTLETAFSTNQENATTLQGQVTALTTEKDSLQGQVTTLTEQVNALKGTPAAGSQSVVTAHKGEEKKETSEADDYLANLNAAKELYDMVGG